MIYFSCVALLASAIFFFFLSSPASKHLCQWLAWCPGPEGGRSGNAARAAAHPPRPGRVLQSHCDGHASATLISTSVLIGRLECHAPRAQSSNAPAGQRGPLPAITDRGGDCLFQCAGEARESAKVPNDCPRVNKKQTSSPFFFFDVLYVRALFSDAVAQSHLKAFCAPNITRGNQSKQ